MKKVRSFLNDAFNDYLAARVLLLSQLPQQAAILSSTAIEKYFKAIMAFRGNESHGHLKSAHWKAVKNFDPRLFSDLDLSFIELNRICYRLRYTDDISIGFNLVIPSRHFLAELDHTALAVQRSFVIKENGAPQKTEFDSLLASRDERLWAENHVLLRIEKEQFVYQAPQFVYEVRNDATIDPARRQYYFRHSGLDPESSNTNIGALCAPLDTGLRRYDALLYSCRIYSGLLEAKYTTESRPKVEGFLRPGLVPKDSQRSVYEFAYGSLLQPNND